MLLHTAEHNTIRVLMGDNSVNGNIVVTSGRLVVSRDLGVWWFGGPDDIVTWAGSVLTDEINFINGSNSILSGDRICVTRHLSHQDDVFSTSWEMMQVVGATRQSTVKPFYLFKFPVDYAWNDALDGGESMEDISVDMIEAETRRFKTETYFATIASLYARALNLSIDPLIDEVSKSILFPVIGAGNFCSPVQLARSTYLVTVFVLKYLIPSMYAVLRHFTIEGRRPPELSAAVGVVLQSQRAVFEWQIHVPGYVCTVDDLLTSQKQVISEEALRYFEENAQVVHYCVRPASKREPPPSKPQIVNTSEVRWRDGLLMDPFMFRETYMCPFIGCVRLQYCHKCLRSTLYFSDKIHTAGTFDARISKLAALAKDLANGYRSCVNCANWLFIPTVPTQTYEKYAATNTSTSSQTSDFSSPSHHTIPPLPQHGADTATTSSTTTTATTTRSMFYTPRLVPIIVRSRIQGFHSLLRAASTSDSNETAARVSDTAISMCIYPTNANMSVHVALKDNGEWMACDSQQVQQNWTNKSKKLETNKMTTPSSSTGAAAATVESSPGSIGSSSISISLLHDLHTQNITFPTMPVSAATPKFSFLSNMLRGILGTDECATGMRQFVSPVTKIALAQQQLSAHVRGPGNVNGTVIALSPHSSVRSHCIAAYNQQTISSRSTTSSSATSSSSPSSRHLSSSAGMSSIGSASIGSTDRFLRSTPAVDKLMTEMQMEEVSIGTQVHLVQCYDPFRVTMAEITLSDMVRHGSVNMNANALTLPVDVTVSYGWNMDTQLMRLFDEFLKTAKGRFVLTTFSPAIECSQFVETLVNKDMVNLRLTRTLMKFKWIPKTKQITLMEIVLKCGGIRRPAGTTCIYQTIDLQLMGGPFQTATWERRKLDVIGVQRMDLSGECVKAMRGHFMDGLGKDLTSHLDFISCSIADMLFDKYQ